MNILFVCHGNICRSVMAEMIFRQMDINNNFNTSSCATSREEIGNSIYPYAKDILVKNNIKIYPHVARQLTKEDYKNFDLIIGMDLENIYNIKRIIGEDINNKVFMLKSFIGLDEEIDDPWYTRDFDKCFKEIYACCEALYKYALERM